MPIQTVPGSIIASRLPSINAYIVENLALEAILFNRNLMGVEFIRACETASAYFFEHFRDELQDSADLAELMVLSKGWCYRLFDAYAQVFRSTLPINMIATRRAVVEGSSVQIEVPYYNYDVPVARLVIGDTVASGTTICTAIAHYLKHHPLREVFVFAIAGSSVGIRRIHSFCESRGIQFHAALGLAAFGLGQNGFDLPFLHPQTVTSDKYRNRAAIQTQGKTISAPGWDFGSQAMAPRKYRMLSWVEAQITGLSGTEVFQETEHPEQPSLIHKEEAAYKVLPKA
jgi:hypothetical protein